ncbi:TauD/TfdA family dioxygenase [Ramlibacter sp. AN1015]|uniref:TauD/TfdA family dioxygenase n=1 Tax=Ramlibacter sp. AN1015 TaxID=3133428 RepID=UPI0030BEF148
METLVFDLPGDGVGGRIATEFIQVTQKRWKADMSLLKSSCAPRGTQRGSCPDQFHCFHRLRRAASLPASTCSRAWWRTMSRPPPPNWRDNRASPPDAWATSSGLEQRGWIERRGDPANRRVLLLASTAEGRNVLLRCEAAVDQAIGLELSEISLAETFSEPDLTAMRQLLVRHKLLVFRGQDISPAQHVAFARRFGSLEVHPILQRHPEQPELVTFVHNSDSVGTENVYHSDTSFNEKPSMGSVLRCVECPEVGGDTIFVNMVAAFEGLPDVVKEKIAKLSAIHDASVAFGNRTPTPEGREQLRKELPPVEHPVVRTHPESGEKILYVNEAFTSHFANYRQVNEGVWNRDAPTQARELFELLVRQARTPEYQVRIQWEKDTVVFWDNRSVQHYAISDYYPNVRSMMRATIIGERPN